MSRDRATELVQCLAQGRFDGSAQGSGLIWRQCRRSAQQDVPLVKHTVDVLACLAQGGRRYCHTKTVSRFCISEDCMWAVPVDNASDSDQHAVLRALLKELRVAKGMRQVDLATRLGVPQSMVSRYEAGDRRLDMVDVRRICCALGTDLPTFVDRYEQRLKTAGRRPRSAPSRASKGP
jgi:DNA-binding XRE family transcriptional regulator